jgi:3-oxoacyl-(acyl-carrier-protein) synthase
MGACGVVELVLCARSFAHGTIPATPGFSEPDPEVGIAPTSSHHPYEGAPVVLNYFGFGGNCASMVMQGGGR